MPRSYFSTTCSCIPPWLPPCPSSYVGAIYLTKVWHEIFFFFFFYGEAILCSRTSFGSWHIGDCVPYAPLFCKAAQTVVSSRMCISECLLRNYCEKEKKIWSCLLLLLYLVMSWKMLFCMKLLVNRGIFIYVELSPLCIPIFSLWHVYLIVRNCLQWLFISHLCKR